MMRITDTVFSGEKVSTCFDAYFKNINDFHTVDKILVITDENIFKLHTQKFDGYPVIVVDGTEKNKIQSTVDNIIVQMLEMNIDKTWLLVGVGGGVITDIAGYVASIYKRGIKLGLVPTSILGMTDAAIGGKNGVNVGMYKNMVGTTYRPQFILYDFTFLDTLPTSEWINGFAEIIKHACIKDAAMFIELEKRNIDFYINNRSEATALIEKNVALKTAVVVADEFEKADRFQLNFGHTFGHALENLYNLPHGHAVSVGMLMAAKVSEEINNFDSVSVERLKKLLQQYKLTVSQEINKEEVLSLLSKDKKRAGDAINFVLLKSFGEATVQQLSFKTIQSLLDQT
ncbi:MAG: 3-dehydroquinate synthase, partial [Ferruginibacter sp.]|nr:3-dehydroquinate synthase [Ferruginibacter sp.]